MSESVQPQHPNAATEPTQRVGTLRALWRLREFAGPAMPAFAGSMAAALVAQLIALTIPQVLAQIVDGPLADGDAAAIAPLTLLVFALGTAEAVLYSLRRWLVVGPGTKVEARMRNALYAKLQDLPVSFHDRWPSGQLLSRAVQRPRPHSPLAVVRPRADRREHRDHRGRRRHPHVDELDARTRSSSSARCRSGGPASGSRSTYSALSRLSQDQAGDLATAVEESVHGIRVLKAFGRGKHALSTVPRAGRVAAQHRDREGAPRREHLGLDHRRCRPSHSRSASWSGVWLAANGQLSVGELVAFFATATVLRWPIESIGFLLAFALDARTATDRFFDILDSENAIVDPEDREAPRPAPSGELAFDRRALPLPGFARALRRPARRRRPRARARRDDGARRPHRQRQDHA